MHSELYHKLVRYLVILNDWRKKRISKSNFLVIAAAVVGIGGGIASSVLKKLTHLIASFLQNDFHWQYKYYLYLFFPLIGIFLTILYVQTFIRRGKFQHGIPAILYNISRNSGKIDFHNIYSQVISAALTVGLGGSAGLEAPAVASGSAIGSNVGRLFGLNYREVTLLLGCGAAAGISGAFNSPIAGMIFAIEVILPEFSIPAVIPLLLSSALASVISKFIYDEPLFALVTKAWIVDAFWYYIALGILIGLYSVFYSNLNRFIFRFFETKIKNKYNRVWIGGITLGVMIALLPALYGEGYITIQKLLDGNYPSLLDNSLFSEYENIGWALLLFGLLSMLGKTFASVITMASGGNGGMFGPTVVVGGLFGFAFAYGLNLTGMAHLNVTNFILAGMAAAVSGVMHAPLTGVFLTAEITGGYVLMVPLMIVSALSYFINKGILKYSIYTKGLAEQGTLYEEHTDNSVLRSIKLKYVLDKDYVIFKPEDTIKSRSQDIIHTQQNIFPVVDEQGKLMSIIFSEQLLEYLLSNKEEDRNRLIKDVAQPAPAVIIADTPMREVIQKMDKMNVRILPVTDSAGVYLGFVTKNNIFKKYRALLIRQASYLEE